MSKAERLATRLDKLNPQATVKRGKGHYVVMVGPKIVGILPYKQAQEGLSYNLRGQFARAGLTVP